MKGFDPLQMLTSIELESCDGTHSLQRIYWWASDVMLNFSKSAPMKKQTVYILEHEDAGILKLFVYISLL